MLKARAAVLQQDETHHIISIDGDGSRVDLGEVTDVAAIGALGPAWPISRDGERGSLHHVGVTDDIVFTHDLPPNSIALLDAAGAP